MAQVINTNYLSLVAQNNLNKSQSALGTAMERLSSGKRINSAKDDAAGLAISDRFTSSINGLTQAARNANDGISLAQTSEGAMSEITNNLQRIKTLATQAANGTNSDSDRTSIQDEIKERMSEIDRICAQTEFNGVSVLNASGTISIQVGDKTGQTIEINLTQMSASGMGIGSVDVSTASGASAAIDLVSKAIDQVDTNRSYLGAIQNRFESVVSNLNNTTNNLSASRSRILDADFSTEVSEMGRNQILQQAGTSVLSQANQVPQNVLSLLR